jgi:hypothetical protein
MKSLLQRVLAVALAIAIGLGLITLLESGKCGLQFGFLQGVLFMSLAIFPLVLVCVGAAVALVLVQKFGWRALAVEGGLLSACVLAMIIYAGAVHPIAETNDTHTYSDTCQIVGP